MDVRGNGYTQITLSGPIRDEDVPFKVNKDVVTRSPLYKFGNALLTTKPAIDHAALELAFIREYQLGYIIVSAGVTIPVHLVPLIRASVTDPVSKVTLLVLQIFTADMMIRRSGSNISILMYHHVVPSGDVGALAPFAVSREQPFWVCGPGTQAS